MREHNHTHDEPPPPGAKHELRDISTRVVVVFAISLVIAAVVIHVGVWLLYRYWGNAQARTDPRQYPMAEVGAPPLPPTPRLQTNPIEDMKNLRAEEERHLRSYGWVDPARGAVHIPIDRAMQLLLERGLPARQQQAPGPGMPNETSSGRTALAPDKY